MADDKTATDKPTAASGEADLGKWVGIGAGIGSAAIAAAVLYANRARVTEALTKRRRPVEHQD